MVDRRQCRKSAIGDGTAQRLHLGVGSPVEIAIGGRVHALKVAALYKADGQHIGARVAFMLPSGQLKDEPATWYGGAHIDPKQVATMERAFFTAYPTITIINVADVLERIESVVDQITFVVRLLAGFSILAGSRSLRRASPARASAACARPSC